MRNTTMIREPLSKQEVIKAIERKNGSKVPLVFYKWWGNGLEAKYGPGLSKMASNYPDDIFAAFYQAPGEHRAPNANPSYRWGYRNDYESFTAHSIGQQYELLPDWAEFARFVLDFPNPDEAGNFEPVRKELPKAGNRYKLGCWWRLFHERFGAIRGMEHMMLDYYSNMEKLKILGRLLLDYYKVIIDRFAALGFDGIFTSDDLGHQRGPMMPPQIFRELYLPLYKEFIGYVHSKGMHVFLHSRGDNTLLMEFLIEAGLDVFHPVQKGCMDGAATARDFGNRLSFLAGVDVQHLLPEGTVADVRKGVRQFIDAFYKPKGGLLLAAGNGIMPDTPLENIQAMLEEMATYR
jgi:uroporphyrinogen decarboxylase